MPGYQSLAKFLPELGLMSLCIYGIGIGLNIKQPMLTGAILAEQGNLDPPLANILVGLRILLSFITVPLWNLLV